MHQKFIKIQNNLIKKFNSNLITSVKYSLIESSYLSRLILVDLATFVLIDFGAEFATGLGTAQAKATIHRKTVAVTNTLHNGLIVSNLKEKIIT